MRASQRLRNSAYLAAVAIVAIFGTTTAPGAQADHWRGRQATRAAAKAVAGARSTRAPSVKALETKGYSPSVARRIIKARPQLARELVADEMGGEAMTVYRGLRVPPHKFVPTGVYGSSLRNSTEGQMWFSKSLATAMGYAQRGPSRVRIVLEVAMPTRFWWGWKHRTPSIDSTVAKADVPDLSPFIERIGVMSSNVAGGEPQFYSYDEALALKLFEAPVDTSPRERW